MKLINKSVYIFFIVLFFLFFGYLRDFIFKKINALLQAWDHDMDYDMPALMKFISNFDYDTIINLKWLLTLIFWGIYLAITIITVRIFFINRQFIKITIAVFAAILLVSGFFILIGMIISSSSEKMYELARYLMGMAQSPIILMVLIPLFKLYSRVDPKKTLENNI